jgi:hypothetical protein
MKPNFDFKQQASGLAIGHALASCPDEFYEYAYAAPCDNDYRPADLRRAA